MIKLQFKDKRQPAFWVADAQYTIGQDEANSLVLNDSEIAQQHAEIVREDNLFYIRDAGSTSGTFVNGERVTTTYQLRPADVIRLGSVELEVLAPQAAKQANTDHGDWSLQAMTGELKGELYRIQNVITIGRSSSCDVHINDDKVSRKHAEIIIKNATPRIRDLSSANGTRVNHKKISDHTLKSGDSIQIGPVSFLMVGFRSADIQDDDDEATVFSQPTVMDPPKKKTAPAKKPRSGQGSKPSAKPAAPSYHPVNSGAQFVNAEIKSGKTGYTMLLVLGGIAVVGLGALFYFMQ